MLRGAERTGEKPTLKKTPAVIRGFDEIAQGGLPTRRTALETDSGLDPADICLDSEVMLTGSVLISRKTHTVDEDGQAS